MIRLRLSLAMLMGAALVFAFPVIERPAGAQPEPKKSDREPPKVVAELVGQIGERRAPGPLGIALFGDYVYLAAWRRGLRVVSVSNLKEPKGVAECRVEGDAKDVVVGSMWEASAATSMLWTFRTRERRSVSVPTKRRDVPTAWLSRAASCTSTTPRAA